MAKGSKLIYRSAGNDAERIEYPLGKMSGLAIYLHLHDIPDSVFEKFSLGELVDKLIELLSSNGAMIFSYYESEQVTALYFYSEGEFADMYAKIAPFIGKQPLCDKSRVVELGVEDAHEFLIDVPYL
jgi:hypothetical protein